MNSADATPAPGSSSLFHYWHRTPLYLRILGGCVLGLVVGLLLGKLPDWLPANWNITSERLALPLEIPSKLVLRLLGALASPLILLAVIRALMHAKLPPGSGRRLVSLLLLNTLVAILIGLTVANVMQPGKWTTLEKPQTRATPDKAGEYPDAVKIESKGDRKTKEVPSKAAQNPASMLLDNVPKSLLGPLGDNGSVLSVILIALAFGIALRKMKDRPIGTVANFVEVAFESLLVILHWIIEVIPIAVFGIVASILAVKGTSAFQALGGFVLAVIAALLLQTVYYLVRIRFGSWAGPFDVLRGMRDALVMAFSTGSSTATMPVTYACLREKVGLRERSASLGALVGANFNNDGTALYEAMSALFISQMLGQELTLWQQLLVVATSVIASVGAAGIPEAGLVTMTLVFNAVGLPTGYIAMLLTVDWFLDRCRTTVNVLGDVNVSCLLDGKTRETSVPDESDAPLREVLDEAALETPIDSPS